MDVILKSSPSQGNIDNVRVYLNGDFILKHNFPFGGITGNSIPKCHFYPINVLHLNSGINCNISLRPFLIERAMNKTKRW